MLTIGKIPTTNSPLAASLVAPIAAKLNKHFYTTTTIFATLALLAHASSWELGRGVKMEWVSSYGNQLKVKSNGNDVQAYYLNSVITDKFTLKQRNASKNLFSMEELVADLKTKHGDNLQTNWPGDNIVEFKGTKIYFEKNASDINIPTIFKYEFNSGDDVEEAVKIKQVKTGKSTSWIKAHKANGYGTGNALKKVATILASWKWTITTISTAVIASAVGAKYKKA